MFMKFRPGTAAAADSANHAALQALQALMAPPLQPLAVSAAPAPDSTAGCGWFDSSYELGQGLSVTEHESFEWLDAGLPLSLWLQ